MPMTENKGKTLIFADLLTLLLATTPIFFDIYRTAAFNTIARDDYAPYTFSARAGQLVLNILPVIVLSLIVILAIKSRQQSSFHISEISSLFVLLILTFITDVGFNVGRIVMYTYPLYLPAAASFIDTVLKMDGALQQ
jgi:hypothetical protein